MANKKPPTRREIILAILALIAFFSIILLLTFLATDLFTIPYLTPFAHFLALIISPFIPLIFPIYLSLFLKVCAYKNRNKEWPGKKKWVFITGCWGFSHFERFVRDSWKIWGKVYETKDIGEVCGLDRCKGYWVEEVLVVLVVLAQIAGWKLDGGMADRWIESLVKREKAAMESAKNADGVESMEKGEVVVEEVIVDEEKRQLMERDEVMAAADTKNEEEEVLIEVETDEVVNKAGEVKA